jgi:hypothetical protein
MYAPRRRLLRPVRHHKARVPLIGAPQERPGTIRAFWRTCFAKLAFAACCCLRSLAVAHMPIRHSTCPSFARRQRRIILNEWMGGPSGGPGSTTTCSFWRARRLPLVDVASDLALERRLGPAVVSAFLLCSMHTRSPFSPPSSPARGVPAAGVSRLRSNARCTAPRRSSTVKVGRRRCRGSFYLLVITAVALASGGAVVG